MKSLSRSAAAIALLCAGATVASAADDSTLALVPGGPHPYFAAWEQAGVDAAADLGLGEASYKIPQKWELAQ